MFENELHPNCMFMLKDKELWGSLHLASSPNKFSRVPKIADGVAIVEDLQYNLSQKLDNVPGGIVDAEPSSNF